MERKTRDISFLNAAGQEIVDTFPNVGIMLRIY